MFAFVLPFLFCACDWNDTLNTTPQNNGVVNKPYSRTQGGTYVPKNDTQGFDPDFTLEDGEYVWFSPYWEEYEGVRLASNPTNVSDGEGVGDRTKSEREKYFGDVYAQFELMYLYIKNYMLCQFDAKIADSVVELSSTNNVYKTKFMPFEPTVLTPYKFDSESEDEILAYNKQIGNTTSGMMKGDISSWVLTPTADPSVFDISVQRDGTKHPFVVDFSAADETKNKNFIVLRLMEILLGVQTPTDYHDDATLSNPTEKLMTYESAFKGLGFSLGDITDSKSAAYKIKEMLLGEVIGSETIAYYKDSPRVYHEPYVTPFTDSNSNGVFDVGEGPFLDVNKNGNYDASFTAAHDAFYADFDDIVDKLTKELVCVVDGENDDLDPNRNGIKDQKYPELISVEILDEDSHTFFHPGVQPSDENGQKRTLTNMEYAEYKSAMFMPRIENPLDWSQRVTFNTLDIYVDGEEDFVMDMYLKVYINEQNYFVCKVCTFNLDHTQSCDWGNEGGDPGEEIPPTGEYENEYDELFDKEKKHNSFSMISLEDLFNYVTEKRTDDYVLVCENPGSYTDAQVMMLMLSPPLGAGKLNEQLVYNDGGYHSYLTTNEDQESEYVKKINAISEKYSYQQINKNGDTALCYTGTESHVEFIFNVVDRDPTVNHNFKFLIKTPDNDAEEEGE